MYGLGHAVMSPGWAARALAKRSTQRVLLSSVARNLGVRHPVIAVTRSQEEGEPRPRPAVMSASQAPPGVSRTFYKRQLPCPPAIEFSSPEGAFHRFEWPVFGCCLLASRRGGRRVGRLAPAASCPADAEPTKAGRAARPGAWQARAWQSMPLQTGLFCSIVPWATRNACPALPQPISPASPPRQLPALPSSTPLTHHTPSRPPQASASLRRRWLRAVPTPFSS